MHSLLKKSIGVSVQTITIFFFIILFFTSNACAKPQIENSYVISDTAIQNAKKFGQFLSLTDNLKVFIDSTNAISVEECVRILDRDSLTIQNSSEIIIYNSSTYWVKLNLVNASEFDQFILVSSIYWEIAEIYTKADNGKYNIQKSGMNHKRPDYGFEIYNYFTLDFDDVKEKEIYFKIQNTVWDPGRIEIKINAYKAYIASLHRHKSFIISCISVLIAGLIYSLLSYIMVRQRIFLLYIIMLIGCLGAYSIYFYYNSFNKYLHFIWAEEFFFIIMIIGLCFFTKNYFSTRNRYKKLNKLINISITILLITYFIHEINTLINIENRIYFRNTWLFAMLFALAHVYVVSIKAAIRRYKPAYYYLAAMSITFFCGIFLILTVLNVFSISSQTQAKQILLFSQIVQLILFSLALGYNEVALRKSRIKVIDEKLELQENLNIELEEKVKIRTAEIRKKNQVLEQQKEEIEAQRDEIEQQKNEVTWQRDNIAKQQKEITASIESAKKIQTAALPSNHYINKILSEYFILFKPRDIVSGDFYWIKQINEIIVIIAADCTGHGVPGSFMSMLGISLLNDIIKKRKITQANYALNELRTQIKQALYQTGEKDASSDGMDISLCAIDTTSNTMQFAGAFNPLYYFRNGNLQIIKGDSMPVGVYIHENESFTNHKIEMQAGDVYYIFSDGYKDQLGGKSYKRFMSGNFKKLLTEIHQLTMNEQKAILEKELKKWRGEVAQIDDILIIGFKV